MRSRSRPALAAPTLVMALRAMRSRESAAASSRKWDRYSLVSKVIVSVLADPGSQRRGRVELEIGRQLADGPRSPHFLRQPRNLAHRGIGQLGA